MFGSLIALPFVSYGVPICLLLLFLWVVVFCVIRYTLTKKEERIHGRKMSAMSELMAHGSFPPRAGNVHYAITNAVFLKELPEKDAIKKNIQEHLLYYRRFRSIPQGFFWNEVEVNIDDQIIQVEVDHETALEKEIERVMNQPIPTNKPRWEIFIIKNRQLMQSNEIYEPSPNAKTTPPYHAILFRIDHCIADGVSLVEVFSKLVTDFHGQPLPSSGLVGLKRGTPSISELPVLRKKTVSNFFIKSPFPFFSKITKLFTGIRLLIKIVKGIPRTLSMATGSFDTATVFTASMEQKKKGLVFSTDQRVAMAGPWSLEYIKLVKAELGISMNDLFMSAFAGAIRRYCIEEGDSQFLTSPEETKERKAPILCRALLPFAFLRNPKVFHDPEAALTNNWTMISAEFAVNENTRLDRAFKTHRIMTTIKRALQPLSNVLVNTVGTHLLPRFMLQQVLYDTYNRHSIVFGNVPGAPAKIRFCGCVVEEVQIFFCGALPQVEIFTYAGRVFFNLVADPKVIHHPEKAVQFFADELRGFGRDLNIKGVSLEFEPTPDSSPRVLVTQSEISMGSSSSSLESDIDESMTKKVK